jgi:hypothetical protein
MYLLMAIPLLLALTFVWQVASGMFHTEEVVRQPVAVGQVSLDPDPAGMRLDFVLVDRVGEATAFNGTLNVTLRDPDGATWETTRNVAPADFQALPEDSLLSGRTGYSLVINARDWARPPRRGGLAMVTITATPNDESEPFSTKSQQRIP